MIARDVARPQAATPSLASCRDATLRNRKSGSSPSPARFAAHGYGPERGLLRDSMTSGASETDTWRGHRECAACRRLRDFLVQSSM